VGRIEGNKEWPHLYIRTMYAFSTHAPCIRTMYAFSTYAPYMHSLHTHHVFILYTHTMYSFSTHAHVFILYIRTMYSFSTYILCIHSLTCACHFLHVDPIILSSSTLAGRDILHRGAAEVRSGDG
jgi:hypothetical protein